MCKYVLIHIKIYRFYLKQYFGRFLEKSGRSEPEPRDWNPKPNPKQ